MDEEEMPQPDVSFWGACDRRVVGWTLRARAAMARIVSSSARGAHRERASLPAAPRAMRSPRRARYRRRYGGEAREEVQDDDSRVGAAAHLGGAPLLLRCPCPGVLARRVTLPFAAVAAAGVARRRGQAGAQRADGEAGRHGD